MIMKKSNFRYDARVTAIYINPGSIVNGYYYNYKYLTIVKSFFLMQFEGNTLLVSSLFHIMKVLCHTYN